MYFYNVVPIFIIFDFNNQFFIYNFTIINEENFGYSKIKEFKWNGIYLKKNYT